MTLTQSASEIDLTPNTRNNQLSGHLGAEVEMGFFENYLTATGELVTPKNHSCQRISHCSCNCNHNSCPLLIL